LKGTKKVNAMNGKKWLTCIVSPGQFRDEFAVSGEDYQGEEFSLFTSREFVKLERDPLDSQETPGYLQILVLEERGGLSLIRLPGQTFDNGSSVTVKNDQLTDCEVHAYVAGS
jgi:hypothetical protein